MMKKMSFPICLIFTTLLMVCVFLPAALMAQNPSVEITPSSGIPEAALKITGKGFQPEEEVDILFILEEGMKIGLGTEKVDVITTDALGAFTANSAIPRMAKPGQYKIEIIGNKGSQTAVSLEVTAKK
jgi:hypothetical protein